MTTNQSKIPDGKHIKKFVVHLEHCESWKTRGACINHFDNCGSRKTLTTDNNLHFMCSNCELSFNHIHQERQSAFLALYPLLVEQKLLIREYDMSYIIQPISQN